MTDYERDLAAGGKPIMSDYDRDLAAGGLPVSMPHDPRAAVRGMRPEPKPDDVQLLDSRSTAEQPRYFVGKNERRQQRAAENPLADDWIGQGIVGGAMVAPAAAVAGGGAAALGAGPLVSRMAGGAAGGVLLNPEHPIKGALIGAALPVGDVGARAIMNPGSTLRAVDDAIGRAAANTSRSFEGAGKAAGAGVGATVGHHAAGFVGAGVGAGVGAKVGGAVGRAVDRGVESLADRYLARTAQFPRPPVYTPPEFPTRSPAPPGPIIDADLVHAPAAPHVPLQLGPAAIPLGPMTRPLGPLVPSPPPPAPMPPGAFGAPMFDEFGMPMTKAGPPAANHATVGGGTVPNLRADVIRDAAKARGEAMPPPGPPAVEDTLGADLANSVRLLDELRAGKITAQQALDAGLPAGVVAKVAH